MSLDAAGGESGRCWRGSGVPWRHAYSFISNFGSQNVHATAFHQFLELGAQIEHSDYCVDALSRFSNILIIDINTADRPPRATLACIQNENTNSYGEYKHETIFAATAPMLVRKPPIA